MTTRHMWRRWLAASWPRDLIIGDVSALEDARATRKSFDVVRPRRHGRDFEAWLHDIVWRRNGWPCTHMDIPGHWSVLYLLQRLLSTEKNCPPIYTGFCLFLSVSMKNNCARFIRNKKYTTFFLGSSPPLLRLTLSLYWYAHLVACSLTGCCKIAIKFAKKMYLTLELCLRPGRKIRCASLPQTPFSACWPSKLAAVTLRKNTASISRHLMRWIIIIHHSHSVVLLTFNSPEDSSAV